MHSLLVAVASAAMAAVVVASPVEATVVPKLGVQAVSHSLPVVKNTASKERRDVLATLEKPYKKYKVDMPEHRLRARAEKRATDETGSVVTTPTAVDVEYLVPLTIQDQTFSLILDTGSSDLWVFSDLMETADQTGHTIFDTSSAKEISGATWSVDYGDGSEASGSVYRSQVQLGGVTVNGMAVEAASSASATFVGSTIIDGLLGLAFPKLNTVSPSTVRGFFARAKKHLAAPLFAVTLKAGSAVGSLDFGYINSSAYTGEISYVDIVKDDSERLYWELPLQNYAIDGTEYTLAASYDAIVDTGTSLMYLPATIVEAYYSQISGSTYDSSWGGYTFPCNSTLLDVGVYVSGELFTVPGENISWEVINSATDTCLGGLQSSADLPFAILGAVFLKDVYAVFEHVKGHVPRLGFAKQA